MIIFLFGVEVFMVYKKIDESLCDKLATLVEFYHLNYHEVHAKTLRRLIEINGLLWSTCYTKFFRHFRTAKKGYYNLNAFSTLTGDYVYEYTKELIRFNQDKPVEEIIQGFKENTKVQTRKSELMDMLFEYSIENFGIENALFDLDYGVQEFLESCRVGKFFELNWDESQPGYYDCCDVVEEETKNHSDFKEFTTQCNGYIQVQDKFEINTKFIKTPEIEYKTVDDIEEFRKLSLIEQVDALIEGGLRHG